MNKRLKSAAAVLFALLLAFSFMAGQQFEKVRAAQQGSTAGLAQVLSAVQPVLPSSDGKPAASAVPATDLFQEVLNLLRAQYVERVDGPSWERKLGYGAVRGMLATLADPYTRFMEPEEHQAFQKENEGHFDGIGATITMVPVPPAEGDETLTAMVRCPYCGSFVDAGKHQRVGIQAPLPNSPAARAGLRPHDLILSIDGESTQGMDLAAAVKLIRGKAGTKVKLLIGREGASSPLEKLITRGVIEVPAVEAKVPKHPGEVASLAINTFNERTAEMAEDAIKRFNEAKAGGLVIDLRDCPGGLFSSALQMARMFVPKGPVVYVQERGRERRPQPSDGGTKGPAFKGPLAVLVNAGSASASEILAGAIQDYRVGTIVGEPTWGKGVVQTVLPLVDGSAVVVTTAKYFTPKGRDINKTSEGKGGIIPDKLVKLPKDFQLNDVRLTDKDPQYAEAVKILQRKVAAR
jgi:carboxyl-terminal processing protease